MKKAKRFIGVLTIALLVVTFAIGLAACNKVKLDPETRAFSMSIQTPDGVFNPFFSTSAYDSSIISLTQIGMLNTDKNGNIVAGLSEPTVALDFTTTPLDENTNPLPKSQENDAVYTDYEFVIKNGIKFSDGSDLTIKDVLFNLYVYLDPVFTGSATMYSTDIVGLNQYRTQTGSMTEAGLQSFENNFIQEAKDKINRLKGYVANFGTGGTDDDKDLLSGTTGKDWEDSLYEDYRNKVSRVAELYKEELTSDWNAINVIDYEKWTGITQKWQIFMLNDIGDTTILAKRDGADQDSGPLLKNDDGNYVLHEGRANNALQAIIDSYDEADINSLQGDAREEAIKNACIEAAFTNVFRDYSIVQEEKNGEMVDVYKVNVKQIASQEFSNVVSYWATATTLNDECVAEAKTEYFNGTGDDDDREFKNIGGVTVYKTSRFNNKQLNGEHYVLRIRINKVDPKAIYNFSYTVSPMKYYSSPEQIEAFNTDFAAWEADGCVEDKFNQMVTHFGVKYADIDFMNDTVNAKSRVGVPIGAGAYKATNQYGAEIPVGQGANGFSNNNIIYYNRNEYFWTVGADGGSQESSQLQNAIIKNVIYKVVESDQIINSLSGGNIDFGDPSATQKNKQLLENNGLKVAQTPTSGYGYIGVNPRYVPNVHVRRAIMMAMNLDLIIDNYYEGGFAERIYRPMSKTNWAYPDAIKEDYYPFDSTGDEIEEEVRKAGYEKDGDGYFRDENGDLLEYKFTIAGGSTDHPAYKTFMDAQDLLNAHGFKVQVVTSATALTDLSAGKLAVWAAAWSSTIDPDMYQVYHINSQASSTSNWGYKQIKADQTKYSFEIGVIRNLSDLIDDARETTDQDSRKRLYGQCLDLVMELAVELPTYQRNDINAFNPNVIDASSLPTFEGANKEVGPYYGLLSRIWEVRYV